MARRPGDAVRREGSSHADGNRDQPGGQRRDAPPADRRPAVEALEDRWLPSLTFQFADGVGVTGSGSVDVESNSVTNDRAGNVYVTGSLVGTADFDPGPNVTNLSSTGDRDAFVAKYTKAGALAWAKDLRGTGASSVAQGGAVAVDASGNVFLSGTYTGTVNFDPNATDAAATFTSPQGGNDVFIAKYDPNGNVLWVRDVAGSAGAIDEGYALAVDGSGNVAVAGSFQNTATFGTTALTSGGSFDSFVTKLNSSGQFLWARATIGSGSSVAQTSGLAFDPSGDVIATGLFAGSVNFNTAASPLTLPYAGSDDIFVQKLGPSGNNLWAESFGSPDIDEGYGVVADASGNIYVSGTFSDTVNFNPGSGTAANLTAGGFEDAFLLKLSPTGQYTWAKDLGETGYYAARGTGVALDGSGHVFVSGYYQNTITLDPTAPGATLTSAGDFDVFVAEYDTAGNFVAGQSAGGSDFDADFGVGVNAAGQVAIAGRYSGPAAFGSIGLPAQPGKSIFIAQLSSSIPVTPTAPAPRAASRPGGRQRYRPEQQRRRDERDDARPRREHRRRPRRHRPVAPRRGRRRKPGRGRADHRPGAGPRRRAYLHSATGRRLGAGQPAERGSHHHGRHHAPRQTRRSDAEPGRRFGGRGRQHHERVSAQDHRNRRRERVLAVARLVRQCPGHDHHFLERLLHVHRSRPIGERPGVVPGSRRRRRGQFQRAQRGLEPRDRHDAPRHAGDSDAESRRRFGHEGRRDHERHSTPSRRHEPSPARRSSSSTGQARLLGSSTVAGDGSYTLQPARPDPRRRRDCMQTRGVVDAAGNVSPLSPPLAVDDPVGVAGCSRPPRHWPSRDDTGPRGGRPDVGPPPSLQRIGACREYGRSARPVGQRDRLGGRLGRGRL